jgi:hypothetical protein
MKEDKMDRACEREEKCFQSFGGESLKERDHFDERQFEVS